MAEFETPVDIGDILFHTMRDSIAEDEYRYTIVEIEVLDITKNHGFLIEDRYMDWRDYERIGEDFFYTFDEAFEEIRNKEDFKGFVFDTADGEKWQFTKRDEIYEGKYFYRISKDAKEKGAKRYKMEELMVTDISKHHGIILEDEEKWINPEEYTNLFESSEEAEKELRDQKDFKGYTFINRNRQKEERA